MKQGVVEGLSGVPVEILEESSGCLFLKPECHQCVGSVLVYLSQLPGRISSALEVPAYHAIDSSRIFLATLGLISTWMNQLFSALRYHDLAPSRDTQESWLGFPLIGLAVLITIAAKIKNDQHAKNNGGAYLAAEDYAWSLFSSSIVFSVFEVYMSNYLLSLMIFIPVCTASLLLLAGFFYKQVIPDSNNKIIFPFGAGVDQLNLTTHLDASKLERLLNALCSGAVYAITSMMGVIRSVNREVYGSTVAANSLQKTITAMYTMVGALFGYHATSHPLAFNRFMVFSRLFQFSALAHIAVSGLYFMGLRYDFGSTQFNLDEQTQNLLSIFCFTTSVFGCGVMTAMTTIFRSQAYHGAHVNLMGAIEEKLDAARKASKTAGKKAGSCCAFFCCCGCCRKKAIVDPSTPLLEIQPKNS